MWGVFDADDEEEMPFALFRTEDEARGYVLLTGGQTQGCIELAIWQCAVDVVVPGDAPEAA